VKLAELWLGGDLKQCQDREQQRHRWCSRAALRLFLAVQLDQAGPVMAARKREAAVRQVVAGIARAAAQALPDYFYRPKRRRVLPEALALPIADSLGIADLTMAAAPVALRRTWKRAQALKQKSTIR
jgi:hypothetical protein